MKITIARLRNGTNYVKPLNDIMDSFYELYKQFMINNPQHQYGVCNFGWNVKNRKNLDDIVDADVIIIPSENEFQQHIDGYIHNKQKERSNEFVAEIGKHLKNKHVIIVRSDRADNEELYRNRTFKDFTIGKFSTFDEMDIPGGLHGMKYHFIKENKPIQLFEPEPKYDFIYWGCDKRKLIDRQDSGDERHLIFKKIKNDNKISSFFIGKYASIDPDKKIDTMYNLLPILTEGKTTLCFNWLDPSSTTSRYHESLACGIFPFVWKNYDCNNTLIADEWQRVLTVEELYDKISNIGNKFSEIEQHYLHNVLKSKSWYYDKFEERMEELLK